MATHFARWTINPSHNYLSLLGNDYQVYAGILPEHRRTRFLASRALLAEMMLLLYGLKKLPEIIKTDSGRPQFADSSLVDFSIAYAGNTVGVMVTTEGHCGLGMELHRAFGTPFSPHFGTNFCKLELAWINNQNDPNEARAQLQALHKSAFKLTDNNNSIELLPGAGRIRISDHTHIEAISDVEDILVWGCTVSSAIDSLKLWEFDTQNGWRALKDIKTRYRDPSGRIIRFTSMAF